MCVPYLRTAAGMEPPAWLPDSFERSTAPRSWAGVVLTAAGSLLALVLISSSLGEFLMRKEVTEMKIESTRGLAFSLALRCVNEDGCDLQHEYASSRCRVQVPRAAPAGWAARRHLRHGEVATALLCGSDHWLDGVRVSAPVQAHHAFARVLYRGDGQARAGRGGGASVRAADVRSTCVLGRVGTAAVLAARATRWRHVDRRRHGAPAAGRGRERGGGVERLAERCAISLSASRPHLGLC